ncbi:MAG: methyltransferase domain-containing protein [Phycisphaerae bacterium]|jgi:SAM-dependent methyltransferase|nr:methyltransferase domain-containing protein [Phycisphaerae bacterium]
MRQPKIVNPGKVRNRLHHVIGAVILTANKIRHAVGGYRTPRPFAPSQIARAVRYDFSVVDGWLDCLRQYVGERFSLAGKRVLELGPGADLGAGVILLAMGSDKYSAVDAHNLADAATDEFYDLLFLELAAREDLDIDIDALRDELLLTQDGAGERLCYQCNRDFDLSVIEDDSIDLIVSQAAFEHFDDVPRTIEQMSKLASPGAVLVCEIDLATHTRWIRDRDPLNIYRFSDAYYNLMKFRGSPNRIRPVEYKQMLTAAGWGDIEQFPLTVLDADYLARVQPSLAGRFRDQTAEMECLSVAVCARKNT